MNPFTVCFLGNRIIDNPIAAEKALNGLIPKLLREKDYVVFLVGRDGALIRLSHLLFIGISAQFAQITVPLYG